MAQAAGLLLTSVSAANTISQSNQRTRDIENILAREMMTEENEQFNALRNLRQEQQRRVRENTNFLFNRLRS